MHELMVASIITNGYMRELWSGPGSHPYRHHNVTQPVRPTTRERVTSWWASRVARVPATGVDPLPAT
jgi:hypothetical protein